MNPSFENPAQSRLRIPEEILVLGLREGGSVKNRMQTEYAVCGGALLELVLAERIRVEGKKAELLSAEPLGHAACDQFLAAIAADGRPKPLGHWIRKFRGHVVDDTAAVLVRAELVQRDDVGVGPFKVHHYPPLPNVEVPELARRIVEVMTGAQPEDREAVLVQLLQLADTLKVVVPDQTMQARHRRLKELEEHAYALPGIRESVVAAQKELQAMYGAMAAAAASG